MKRASAPGEEIAHEEETGREGETAREEETAPEEETTPEEEIALGEKTAPEEKQKIPEIELPYLDSFIWGSHKRSKVGTKKFLHLI